MIRRGLADYRATGAELFSPYFLALLADAHGRADQAGIGLSLLADALDGVERTGVRWIEAELHRLGGELRLATPEPDQSRGGGLLPPSSGRCPRAAGESLGVACSDQPARLWQDQRRNEAHDLLAPIYGWFTEGFDIPDLKQAKALLHELG